MIADPKSMLLFVTHLKARTPEGSFVTIKANKGVGIAFLDLDPAGRGFDYSAGVSDAQFDEMLKNVGLKRIAKVRRSK